MSGENKGSTEKEWLVFKGPSVLRDCLGVERALQYEVGCRLNLFPDSDYTGSSWQVGKFQFPHENRPEASQKLQL